MVRPLRIARSDGQDWTYRNDEARWAFLDRLGEGGGSFNWALCAYCLMGNHYQRRPYLAGDQREPDLPAEGDTKGKT